MNKSYPLYDVLAEKEPSVSFDKIYPVIAKLSKTNNEILYSLILHHYNVTNKNIPYSGKIIGSNAGILYKVNDLPEDLKKILAIFIKTIVS